MRRRKAHRRSSTCQTMFRALMPWRIYRTLTGLAWVQDSRQTLQTGSKDPNGRFRSTFMIWKCLMTLHADSVKHRNSPLKIPYPIRSRIFIEISGEEPCRLSLSICIGPSLPNALRPAQARGNDLLDSRTSIRDIVGVFHRMQGVSERGTDAVVGQSAHPTE